MPKLCFVMVLTSCKDFLQIVRIFCHDLTDRSCPKLTPLLEYYANISGLKLNYAKTKVIRIGNKTNTDRKQKVFKRCIPPYALENTMGNNTIQFARYNLFCQP